MTIVKIIIEKYLNKDTKGTITIAKRQIHIAKIAKQSTKLISSTSVLFKYLINPINVFIISFIFFF